VLRLQNVDIFSAVPLELLSQMAALADEVEYSSSDLVFAEGDPPDSVYIVLAGRVRIDRGSEVITEIGSGQTFGTWALLEQVPRLFSARVVEDASLLRIHQQDLAEFMADLPLVSSAVLTALASRLRRIVLGGNES